jgi:hypothetical protein
VIYATAARFELIEQDGWVEARLTLPWQERVPT